MFLESIADVRTWVDSGLVTDSDGQFMTGTLNPCPQRMAAVLAHEGRGEEDGPVSAEATDESDFLHRVIVMEDASSISGQVLDTEGVPVEGVYVSAAPTRSMYGHYFRSKHDGSTEQAKAGFAHARLRRWAYTTETNADGVFVLDTIPTEQYLVLAESDGYESNSLEVDPTADEDRVVITLEQKACGKVRVVDTNDTPVSGAVVHASVSAKLISNGQRTEAAETDGYGLAELCDIPLREVHLEVTAENKAASRTRVDLVDVEATVQLYEGGNITGDLNVADRHT